MGLNLIKIYSNKRKNLLDKKKFRIKSKKLNY